MHDSALCARESGRGTSLAMLSSRAYERCVDGIAFHRTIISGRGQYVLPQAIDLEVYDKNLSANLPTNV